MQKSVRTAIGAGCAYEVFALATGRVPTISAICRKFWPVEVTVLTALVLDFHWDDVERIQKSRIEKNA